MKNTKNTTKSVATFYTKRAAKIAAARARNTQLGLSERDKRAIAKFDREYLSSVAGL